MEDKSSIEYSVFIKARDTRTCNRIKNSENVNGDTWCVVIFP